jgi:plastocyanin
MSARRSLFLAFLAVVVIGALSAGMALADKAGKAAKVTVKETEYKLTFSSKTLSPGATTFVIVNDGTIPHSFAIKGPGVSKQLHATLKPHATATLTVTLKSGSYSFWCPVPGHAGLGMKKTFAVGSASATASTGSTGTGTGSGSSGGSSGGWG